MHLYRQSIIVFGIVLPLLLFALAFGGLMFAKGKVAAEHEERVGKYRSHRKNTRETAALQDEIAGRRKLLEKWNEMLAIETSASVTAHLGRLEEKLPGKEFQTTAQSRDPEGGTLAGNTPQASEQMKVAFRGTFRSVQLAFLELESRMPRLQLESLEVEPSDTPNLLEFSAAYTSWKK